MLTAMALSVPSPRTTNPLARIRERPGHRVAGLPPGSASAGPQAPQPRAAPSSCAATRSPSCCTAYEEYGPIFSMRIFHG